MDQIMGKVGGYWFNQNAGNEMNNIGDDINSVSSSIGDGAKWMVNKIKGKTQKPLCELLKEHDLPMGLFPQDATSYDLDEETKKLTVHVAASPYRDSSLMRFASTVSGRLEKGRLGEIEGKILIIWTEDSAKVQLG